ncbi:unnamed protein product [Rangifer tarandus platyrhynchus]|uniref:Uncharacterized protein n=1 Tax=Rangifer tarandus platyrhynchus TaxID=3082113 RepID=A0AC60A7Y0_RANTA
MIITTGTAWVVNESVNKMVPPPDRTSEREPRPPEPAGARLAEEPLQVRAEAGMGGTRFGGRGRAGHVTRRLLVPRTPAPESAHAC